jgi:hypothetical protein
MEAAVTDRGTYTPYPSWFPPDRWQEGRHHRPAHDPTPTSRPDAGTGGRAGTRTGDRDTEDLVIELRNQVVDRMRLMNARHGYHAWERAGTDPIAPHGLAFLYADHDPRPTGRFRWRIRAATRLFLDGPETAHLPRLLWEQTRIADGYRRVGKLDPRTQLANRVEPMTRYARYFGVGVSTLDVPDRPWARQRQSDSGYDIMGRCLALLADDTWLLLHRGLPGHFSGLRIWSSQTLDSASAMNPRRWDWGRHLPDLADVATRDIWLQLQTLHDVLSVGNDSGGGHGR